MADPISCRDLAAACALIDAMIGWTAVGADGNGDEISRATSPVVRAHMEAALGDACMNHGGDTKPGRREAMATYLRSVASYLVDNVDGMSFFDALVSDAEVDVLVERSRQISVEGWSAEHDDAHKAGEMAAAATGYVMHAVAQINGINPDAPPGCWPWDAIWWKPSSPRRNLEKAAALIIAEMERLDRAEERASKGTPDCPACEGSGWLRTVHLNGQPDAQVCPACKNPDHKPCPWRLP